MQLLRLRLVNFRQHEATDLHFSGGLTGIVGVNGAGKTTLLEAIAYALYGVTATRGTRDTLRRRGAPPRSRFEVELEFSLGAHQYRVVRGLTQAEFFQDGHSIANSTGTVTERIATLLGMSRDEFFNTYFTGQKELAVMAAMGAVERAQFLSRVLGYEKLREAQDALRANRGSLRSELTGIEQGLVDPAALEADLEVATRALAEAREARDAAAIVEGEAADQLAALTPEWEAAQLRRTAWQSLDGERRVAEQQVASAKAAFHALDRELTAAVRAKTRLGELMQPLVSWPALVAEREVLDQAAQEWNARSRLAARREQARQRLGELSLEVAALPSAERAAELVAERTLVVTQREASEQLAAERRTRWTQDAQETRTRLEQFRDRYRELEDQRALIQAGGPDGICPTCGRPLGKDFPTLLALLDRQLEEIMIDGKYLRQRDEQLKELPPELHDLEESRQHWERELRRLTEAQGQVLAQLRQRVAAEQELVRLREETQHAEQELTGPAANYDAERHTAVREELAVLEPLRREHDQLVGVASRAEPLVAEATVAERLSTEAEAALILLDHRIALVGWDSTQFEALEHQLRGVEAMRHGARVTLAEAGARSEGATRLRDGVVARQRDRAQRASVAHQLGNEINLLHELDRAFSELRTELNLQLRPDLAERASRLLHDLTAGRYDDLELDESYLPTVVDDGEAQPVLSGGEEDIVNLALRLAISQMIADRAGQPLSLLVLDEIFGSLDEDRRSSVLGLLRALSDRFPQVILITHVEGMRDAFDRVIRMVYDVETGITTAVDDTLRADNVAV